MFKTLNQQEMLKVNGGFYYVPVYDIIIYLEWVDGHWKEKSRREILVRLDQVSSSSGERKRIRNIIPVYP